jgi:glycosyltransferase involved in cell wall biosynthesis
VSKPPRVSVLMPVRNNERYVGAACESILQQTFGDLELVVLDDGSTDRSRAVVEALANADERVRLIPRGGRPLIQSRNELLEIARSPVVAWMDSDDIARPERIEHQLALLDASPDLVCLGGAALVIDPDGAPIDFEVYPEDHDAIVADQQQLGGAMRFPTTVMRRDVARAVGGFRNPFEMAEDLDLLVRMSEVGRMANTSVIVLDYREHLTSTSRFLSHRWPVYRDLVLQLADERAETGSDALSRGEELTLQFEDPPPVPDLAWETRDEWARRALRAGHLKTARKHMLVALSSRPYRLRAWKLCARVLVDGIKGGWRGAPEGTSSQPAHR